MARASSEIPSSAVPRVPLVERSGAENQRPTVAEREAGSGHLWRANHVPAIDLHVCVIDRGWDAFRAQ